MSIAAKVLCDSINPYGNRLTTLEVTYPRFIHAEMLRHRMFSRNVASSRAIPFEKTVRQVMDYPVIPLHWGANQKGMVAGPELNEDGKDFCKQRWLRARDAAVHHAAQLNTAGLHKQIVNRLLEPWTWTTEIISSTTWKNFFSLRIHPAAEPHIQATACAIKKALDTSTPTLVLEYQHHTPLTGFSGDESLSQEDLLKVSIARCARVSYLTHDGRRDVQADLALFERLLDSRHLSPFEHVATPKLGRHGNFMGWCSYRNAIPNESGE